jgi:hypothetical protein
LRPSTHDLLRRGLHADRRRWPPASCRRASWR